LFNSIPRDECPNQEFFVAEALEGLLLKSVQWGSCTKQAASCMKWVTREKAKVDRIACPWLITHFVDKEAEFLFVQEDKVASIAEEQGAIPFDCAGVQLSHYEEDGMQYVSFDAVIKKYGLKDPALLELAKIVRGADAKILDTPRESAGLEAAALGFRELAKNDFDNMRIQFPLYDALYKYCELKTGHPGKLEHSIH
jgi:hypothetical protein